MSELDFERIIKDKLQQTNFAPTTSGWERLQQKMQAGTTVESAFKSVKEKEPVAASFFSWKKTIRIAAVLLPLIAIAVGYQQGVFSGKEANVNNQSAQTVEPTNTNNTATILPSKNKEAIQNNTIINNSTTNNSTKATEVVLNNTTSKQNSIKIKEAVSNTSFTKAPTAPTVPMAVETEKVNNYKKHMPVNENKTIEENKKEIVAVTPKEKKPATHSPEDVVVPSIKNSYSKKTTLSLLTMASSNVANINGNAVQVGVAAEKKLNKRLYVDVTASIGRNNPTWWQQNVTLSTAQESSVATAAKTGYNVNNTTTDVNAFGVNATNNNFVAGGNNIPITELQTDATVAEVTASRLASYQVEATPMVGYQLLHNFSIAAGADVAKILNTKEYTDGLSKISLHSRSMPTVNNWDAGIVGKLEYKLYKNIIIGYRYRQGVTNLVQGYNTTKRSFNSLVVKVKI